MPEPALFVDVLNHPDAFANLRGEWNALLAASEADTPFLTWEWLYTWWRHLGERRRLRILAVRRGEELLAVAPLALRPNPGGLLPPRFEFLGTGTVGSDYLDFVARKGSEAVALAALADHAGRQGATLELRQVRGQGSLAAQLAGRLQAAGWNTSEVKTETCPFIPLKGRSWDSYLASLGSEHRYNFKRRLRKLHEGVDTFFETAASEGHRRAALALLFDLHEQRWRERGGSDAFPSGKVRAFHDEFTRLALARGWLRLFVLWLDGEPAAALYGLRYGKTFSFYQSGFDPRHAKQSVGLVMMGLAIKAAIEEGAEEFDLLHGAEAYKFQWARQSRELVRLELDPPRAGAVIYRRFVDAGRAARRLARRLLPAPLAHRLPAGMHPPVRG